MTPELKPIFQAYRKQLDVTPHLALNYDVFHLAMAQSS